MRYLSWNSLLTALVTISASTPAAPSEMWTKVHEDLSEYSLSLELTPVSSDIVCTGLVTTKRAKQIPPDLTGVAVQYFNKACRLWTCARGVTGCRKCRNFANASLPAVWILPDSGFIKQPKCWRTFLHRVDDSVDFYRSWSAYKSEFGQGEGLNYWMGLDRLHDLTVLSASSPPRARWEFSLWNDTWYWSENVQFIVLNESYKYQAFLGAWDSSVSNVAQCPVNISWYMSGSRFSTYDSDNDAYAASCSVIFHGAWWYKGCHCFNPTGRYFRPPLAYNLSTLDTWATGITYFTTSMTAYPFNHVYSMMSFEALIEHRFG